MTERKIKQEMLKPVDDTSDVQFPPYFAVALGEVRAAVIRCDEQRIPKDTVLAALLTELIPLIVDVYGPNNVATMLNQLACELSSSSPLSTKSQQS